MTVPAPTVRPLAVVREQFEEAIAAPKCHSCGCFQKTVEALGGTAAAKELAPVIARARSVFVPKEYDCLGCPVCYPAIAANAFAEDYPDAAEGLDLCPTEEPEQRDGWPPLPGGYRVARYRAPVAVCVLNSEELVNDLASRAPDGMAIVGTMCTENLGIERVIRNVQANPNIRALVLCGEDAQQAVGHLPGQSLASLFASGVDERGRIVGARGKRPVLKNVSRAQIDTFRAQVSLVALIGETDAAAIVREIARAASAIAGPFSGAPEETPMPTVMAHEPQCLVPDPAGYFVIYPDTARNRLFVEHYTNQGVLDCVIEGATSAAIYSEVIARGLLSRLDHAAYLGRELARTERSLATGEPYVQDRAAGELDREPACGCGPKCGTEATSCRD